MRDGRERYLVAMRSSLPLLFLIVAACEGSKPPPNTTSSAAPPPEPVASASANAPAATETAGELAVGKPAPDFSAKSHDGTDLKISSLKGKHVVVYFYPKDETPGCTKEACSFRDAWKDLSSTGVVLIGISTDTVDSHKKFAEHHKLPFHLVSDPDGSIAKQFGVPNNNGYLKRESFVIGPDGNVKKIYRDVDVTKHATEILADVKS